MFLAVIVRICPNRNTAARPSFEFECSATQCACQCAGLALLAAVGATPDPPFQAQQAHTTRADEQDKRPRAVFTEPNRALGEQATGRTGAIAYRPHGIRN